MRLRLPEVPAGPGWAPELGAAAFTMESQVSCFQKARIHPAVCTARGLIFSPNLTPASKCQRVTLTTDLRGGKDRGQERATSACPLLLYQCRNEAPRLRPLREPQHPQSAASCHGQQLQREHSPAGFLSVRQNLWRGRGWGHSADGRGTRLPEWKPLGACPALCSLNWARTKLQRAQGRSLGLGHPDWNLWSPP